MHLSTHGITGALAIQRKRKRATCTRVPASQSISMLTVIVTHEPNLRSNINMDNTRGGDQR